MGLFSPKGLRGWTAGISLMLVMFGTSNTFAAAFTYPTNFPPQVVPFVMGNGDTLTVLSPSTMQSTTNLPYIVDFSGATAAGVTITVNLGATIAYEGTNSGGASLNCARNDANPAITDTINVNGTVNAGTGLYAMKFSNINAGANDAYVINVSTTGVVDGAILTNSVASSTLNLTGNATISGAINLGYKTGGTSNLIVGASSTATFTPTFSINNIGMLRITNSSTMTLNVPNANIAAVTIDPGSTLNVNTALVGLAAGDGAILNDGTMNIAAGISKLGGFGGTGTNVVTQGGATGLSITTSSYHITNHTAVMTDINDYGNITLTTGDFKLNNGGANAFNITNGGGYFPGGTYTLVTVNAGAGSLTAPTPGTLPASTLFLTFAPFVVNSNKIQITLTRSPFTNYTTSALTTSIAQNLEIIGTHSPSLAAISLLNAVEASTNANEVEFAMRQLAPLANAPFYGYDVQNESMYQVQLRLASLRDKKNYFAGDVAADDHIWMRPFGAYANQRAKEDSLGYYATSGGIAVGIDRDLDDRYTLGAAFIYALSHVRDKINPQSITDIKSYIGAAYGTYNFSDTQYLDWILAVTANNFNANRLIDINNSYIQTATSAYGSQQISVRGIWGKNYEAFGFMQLTPEGLVQYSFAKQYPYTETGAPGANLEISRTNSNILTLGLGGKAAVPIFWDPSIVMPEIHGWWYYNPIVGKQSTIFSFVEGGGPITSIMNLSRTGLLVGAALTIAVIDKMEVKFNFDYDIEDRFNGWTAFLNLRYTF